MHVTVRLADLNDVDILVKARFDYFEAEDWTLTPVEHQSFKKTLEQYYHDHLNKDFFAALVERDGDFAATAFLTINRMPANVFTPTGANALILNVLTYPAHRRNGCATLALNTLIDIAGQHNVSHIKLSASEMGRPVYEKLGFKVDVPTQFTPMKLELQSKTD